MDGSILASLMVATEAAKSPSACFSDELRNVDVHRTACYAGSILTLQTSESFNDHLILTVAQSDLFHVAHPLIGVLGGHIHRGDLNTFPEGDSGGIKVFPDLLSQCIELFTGLMTHQASPSLISRPI